MTTCIPCFLSVDPVTTVTTQQGSFTSEQLASGVVPSGVHLVDFGDDGMKDVLIDDDGWIVGIFLFHDTKSIFSFCL